MRAEPAALEASIGYRFSNPELLTRALTHSSLANEALAQPGAVPGSGDNERMEFLGDSILGFLVAEALVARHPDWREGELSRFKAHLVSAAHLHGVARRLNFGQYLQLGRSEEMSGGRYKKTLLADAVEAILAAVYLDGGVDPARSSSSARTFWTPSSTPMKRPAPISSPPLPISRARFRSWPSPWVCRNRATPSCGSAAPSTRNCSPSKSGSDPLNPLRPMDAPRRSPRSAPPVPSSTGFEAGLFRRNPAR